MSGGGKSYSPIVDENEDRYGIKHIDNKPLVSATPIAWEVSRGQVSNMTRLLRLGLNEDVDDASETLWEVGGQYVFPTGGMGMEVVSTDDEDGPGNTGALVVEIHYLDTNFEAQQEDVTMNGETPVATNATDILRVNKFHVETTGGANSAVGDISLRHLDDTPIYSRITAGENTSRQAIFTVPADTTLYLTQWQVGVGSSQGNRFARFELEATMHLDGTLTPNNFHHLDIAHLQDGMAFLEFTFPVPVPAKADVLIRAISDNVAANAQCAGHFEGWLET